MLSLASIKYCTNHAPGLPMIQQVLQHYTNPFPLPYNFGYILHTVAHRYLSILKKLKK